MGFSIENELAALSPETRTRVESGLAEVWAKQRALGMEPRDDSQLTFNFASGRLSDDTAESVAQELVAVDRIFKTTRYPDIVQDALPLIANHLKQRYKYLTWTEVWEIARFYGPTMLKLYCAKQPATRARI